MQLERQLRCIEVAHVSGKLRSRSRGFQPKVTDAQVVASQIDHSRQAIDVLDVVLNLNLAAGTLEIDLVASRDWIARHPQGRECECNVQLLRPVHVAESCIRHRQILEEIVGRLSWLTGTFWRSWKVVAPVHIDDVLEVDVFDDSGLDHVAPAKELTQAQIDARTSDRREWRQVRDL